MSRHLFLIVSFLAISPVYGNSKTKAPRRPAAEEPAPTATTVSPPQQKVPAQGPEAETSATPAANASPLRQAQDHFRKKEFSQATNLLWKNISKLDRSGLTLLMKAHKAKGEWSEVIRASNLILSKNPKDEEAMTYMGEAQFRRAGKSDEAKETLQKVLEINPKYQPAYEVLAQIYEKNPYEKRLLYQDMVETFGPRSAFLNTLCALNVNDGENEQGEKYCQQGIEADPKFADNYVYLGVISKQKEEMDKAKIRLKKAADKFDTSEFAQWEFGNFSEIETSWIDANKYYERCVKADPKSERCWAGLGNSALQLRNYPRSIDAFTKACRISGRKNSAIVRKAASVARQRKDVADSEKLSRVAERCSY